MVRRLERDGKMIEGYVRCTSAVLARRITLLGREEEGAYCWKRFIARDCKAISRSEAFTSSQQ